MKHYLAFDLGATSGRALINGELRNENGELRNENGEWDLREIHRFSNTMIHKDGHIYWDWAQLWQEIKTGLTKAAQTGLEIESVGIDTWGVDVLFIGKDGQPLGNPYAYRDPQTSDAPERFFRDVMPSGELYARTGIQVMPINTLFQLYTLRERQDPMLMQADKILFLPDAFNYMLTGRMATEYTIASTSQLLDAHSRRLDTDLLHRIGLSEDLFAPMVDPGTYLGTIRPEIAEECGIPQWKVIAIAGHDTASAVASQRAETAPNPDPFPLKGQGSRHAAYLSSGTWSLLGVELDEPILTPEAQQMNITNEGGINGKIRFLKNITGMWIVEGLRKDWADNTLSYDDIVRLAKESPCVCLINPDDPLFAAPESMQQAIDTYCAQHHLTQPKTRGEYLRCVFESLAHRYAEVLKMIQSLLPYTIDELHIIGGGSKNLFLNELTAKATGLKVIAGPAEATTVGNILVQQSCTIENGELIIDMKKETIMAAYEQAKERYAALGIDTDKALKQLEQIHLSLHCWQTDDVTGFEQSGEALSGGIQATGNYPGKARNIDEVRQDIEYVKTLIPGDHRLSLHAIYGDFGGKKVDRDQIEPCHFQSWIDWAKANNMKLDFNSTSFSHPKSGDMTLAHRDAGIREFWIEHTIRSRKIAEEMGRQLDSPACHNLWIHDGSKDITVDRYLYRSNLKNSLDTIFAVKCPNVKDAVECKLFGTGLESFTVGSHEFYLGYAVRNGIMATMDMGHFHPTEEVYDKLSALLLFSPEVLLHVSRPVRWDSDHVVILNDSLTMLAQEIVWADALDRVHYGLDYFDASLNRIGAYVIGSRATQKAFLQALLSPIDRLRKAEAEGNFFERLALLEEAKGLPWNDVYNYFCLTHNVPVAEDYIAEIHTYERNVLSKR